MNCTLPCRYLNNNFITYLTKEMFITLPNLQYLWVFLYFFKKNLLISSISFFHKIVDNQYNFLDILDYSYLKVSLLFQLHVLLYTNFIVKLNTTHKKQTHIMQEKSYSGEPLPWWTRTQHVILVYGFFYRSRTRLQVHYENSYWVRNVGLCVFPPQKSIKMKSSFNHHY